MWGVEFNNDTIGQFAMLSIIKEGVLQNYCGNKKDTLIIMPPLVVEEEEIEEIIKRIGEGVKKIKQLVWKLTIPFLRAILVFIST